MSQVELVDSFFREPFASLKQGASLFLETRDSFYGQFVSQALDIACIMRGEGAMKWSW